MARKKTKANPKVLVLLPCTNKKPYTKALTWKFVLKHIGPYMNHVSLAAVDCITNPRTGRPYGIVTKSRQFLTVGKDERPDPRKFDVLVKEIDKKLERMAPHYDRIVSYLNVKVYWRAVEQLQKEYGIKMLPTIYRQHPVWNSKKLHMGPIGMFKVKIGDLTSEIERTIRNGT